MTAQHPSRPGPTLPPPDQPDQPQPAPNRAQRRAKGAGRSPLSGGTGGTVRPTGSGYARDPRQYAAHRKG